MHVASGLTHSVEGEMWRHRDLLYLSLSLYVSQQTAFRTPSDVTPSVVRPRPTAYCSATEGALPHILVFLTFLVKL